MKSWADFLEKLSALREKRESELALFLNPRLENLPLSIARFDDPLLPYGKEIIRASQDLVVAYVFDLASYFSLGAAGIVALERTIRFAGDSVTILHAPFATENYSAMADITGLGVDALTVTDLSIMKTYLEQPPYAAFAIHAGEASSTELPEAGGLISFDEDRISYLNLMRHQENLQVSAEELLAFNRGEDYLEQLRLVLEAMKGR
jgi:hypothetical protein